ncbi:helix-turn-helix transcriptional regulator [Pseudomonas sp. CDFA 602]|uniref:helix-turn-helix domain-containing protein n=1 Tax=Pseudomonas californiensis TaxID=2829823 RepID=UPI001E542CDC|nr:AraC family transcriptional regulator [Pseudomonas californiensis]MCD5996752.1 helix-turn-helix transcriptional regulator [Pseudomonas californiensis]MCD6002350.1 helix-turn-helix transcriptional regulator [Pseudomonas californiensis]
MTHFSRYPCTSCASAQKVDKPSDNSGGLSPCRERMAKQLILDNLSENIEVAELAKACALSRSYFSRAFKRSTGLSPQEWIRAQRLVRAKCLIQHTAMSLTQISQECGFCDQSHFSHIFSRAEGVNPFTWRGHARNAGHGEALAAL